MIIVGLGSNIEPRADRLAQARVQLATISTITQVSPIYETQPLRLVHDATDHTWFLNQVVSLTTALSPVELLQALKAIEKKLGRRHRQQWEDREIDLDIIVYDDALLTTPGLTVPHLQLTQRRFWLQPLADIAPLLIDPRSKKTIRQLLKDCKDPLAVRPYSL